MTATPLVEPATGISQELVYPQSSASSPLSLTLPSPAIITSQASFSNSGSSGFKRGRLLIRQQRVKKDGEVSGGGDLETPDVYTSSDSYLLSVPSSSIASARIERHASEPSPATFTPSVSSQNLLNVPTQSSSSSYLVKQHSHPLLPSQTSSSSSYTLTRQLSYPTQMTVQSQTIANTSSFSSHAAQEIVAGQLLQLQHHKPPNVRSHTMPHYSTVSEMDVVSEQRQESPTVVIIPDISHESNIEHHQQTHIQSQKQMQQQLPTIRVKSEELQRSISSPMASTRSDLSFETTARSSHCPTLRPGPALGCNFCWNTIDAHGRILRRKTKYHCPECQTNLCIVPCFQEYHERQSQEGNEGNPVSAKTSGLKGLKSSSL